MPTSKFIRLSVIGSVLIPFDRAGQVTVKAFFFTINYLSFIAAEGEEINCNKHCSHNFYVGCFICDSEEKEY